MKPIALFGHDRSITTVKYNREGDLLFSSAKDNQPTVWYSINGERLGTFEGHGGAVWCIDCSWDSSKVLTGSADNSCRIWDCETGKQMGMFDTRSAVRTCGFSYSGQTFMYSTDKAMGHACEIVFFDTRDSYQMKNAEPFQVIPINMPKVTSALNNGLDRYLITGHEDGSMIKWDIKSGEKMDEIKEHTKSILDIQPNNKDMMIITASKDTSAKLFDAETLELLKTYKTERPVNSATISPIRDHVILGGGQEAMDVTTTSTRIGKFDARFFHLVFEEEFARVKGHFGPINSVAFHPDGKSFVTGGEDGYVRINNFDQQYFDFEFEF
ncbi:eukaryotic translation initiation factor 3 subunit I-like [Amphiura filiformis]|uniref:eukaryotic translation initiation factor 3 subunit I-like n=1 Tax=Amphiura filiformis TaxID=82378 RepID=UPI003B22386E